MNNTLTHFNISDSDLYRIDNEIWITPRVLASALGYSSPSNVLRIIKKNQDVLDACIGMTNLVTPSGTQETTILSEEAVYLICIKSQQPIAKKFQLAFIKTMKAIRKGEYVHVGSFNKLRVECGQWMEKAVQHTGKRKISDKKKVRYFALRDMGVYQWEAANALRIPLKKARQFEKARAMQGIGVTEKKPLPTLPL